MAKYIKKCEYCGKEFVTKRCHAKFCCNKCGYKQWREQNKEHKKEYDKQWREQNKEYHKQWYEQNKEYCREYYKQWREKNEEYHKEYQKEWREQNREYNKQWREQNKEHNREYQRQKYNTDLNYKLTRWSRQQVKRCLKYISTDKTKDKHTFDILGYTTEQLKQRLEMNFKPDMTWENHDTLWHIDHRKPLCKFNLTLPDGTPNYEQIRLANSLANLQPLYATENLSKGGR